MRMSAQCDTRPGFAQLDALRASIDDVAKPRTLNTLADQAETAGFRKIGQVYDIPARTMQRYASRRDARAGDLEASITVKGRGFPLSEFRPKQTARGVSVVIKGRRIVIPHTFMVRRFGQHVFARGAYGGKGLSRATGESFGRFAYGRTRLPINELYTFAPPDAWSNPEVVDAINARVDEQAGKVLQREIAAVSRGF